MSEFFKSNPKIAYEGKHSKSSLARPCGNS